MKDKETVDSPNVIRTTLPKDEIKAVLKCGQPFDSMESIRQALVDRQNELVNGAAK